MEKRKIESEILENLIWGFNNTGRANEAYKLLEMMPILGKQPDELDYIAAIEVCIRQKNLKLASNIIYQSQVFGISLDTALYDEFLLSLIKASDLNNTKLIISKMVQEGTVPTIDTCNKLLKLSRRKNDKSFVEDIENLITASNVESSNSKFIQISKKEYKREFNSFKSTILKLAEDAKGLEEERQKVIKDIDFLNKRGNRNLPVSFQLVFTPKADMFGIDEKEFSDEDESESEDSSDSSDSD